MRCFNPKWLLELAGFANNKKPGWLTFSPIVVWLTKVYFIYKTYQNWIFFKAFSCIDNSITARFIFYSKPYFVRYYFALRPITVVGHHFELGYRWNIYNTPVFIFISRPSKCGDTRLGCIHNFHLQPTIPIIVSRRWNS